MYTRRKLLRQYLAAIAILSLIVLAVAIVARYRFRLAGGWRRTYVITAVIALYFNVFVLIVQLFLKVPSLKAIAPTQSEPPFQVAQLIALLLFVFLGIRAAMKFHSEPPARFDWNGPRRNLNMRIG